MVALVLLLVMASSALADALDSWTKIESGVSQNLYGVAYGQSRHVCVGQLGVILVSSNGGAWLPSASGVTSNLLGVAFGNGAFVAVGTGGLILRSTNAANWLPQTSPTTNHLNGVAHCNGLFVATGNSGTLLTSPDGATWTARNSTTTRNLHGAAWGNGQFTVVGWGSSSPGTVLNSSNAVDWLEMYLGIGLYCTAFGNRTFVAMDSRAIPYTSSGGTNWTSHFTANNYYIFGITFAQNLFVGAGGPFLGGSQTIVTSPDGVKWRVRPVSVTNSASLRGVTYGNGYFIAVGDKGMILKSGPVFTLRLNGTTGGIASLLLEGEISRGYRLQACTNPPVGDWLDLLTTTNTSEVMPLTDSSAGGEVRLYRAVSP